GHGGVSAAIALRQRNFKGSVLLVSEDVDLPYERPPLSKDYLSGEKTFERIMFRPSAFWDDRAIELHLGDQVVEVEPEAHSVRLRSGKRIGYKQMIWSAGGRPRELSCTGAHLAGVHSIRSRRDVDKLTQGLAEGSSVAVIGAGYIGLETAAVLRQMACEVVVLEALDRV